MPVFEKTEVAELGSMHGLATLLPETFEVTVESAERDQWPISKMGVTEVLDMQQLAAGTIGGSQAAKFRISFWIVDGGDTTTMAMAFIVERGTSFDDTYLEDIARKWFHSTGATVEAIDDICKW